MYRIIIYYNNNSQVFLDFKKIGRPLFSSTLRPYPNNLGIIYVKMANLLKTAISSRLWAMV